MKFQNFGRRAVSAVAAVVAVAAPAAAFAQASAPTTVGALASSVSFADVALALLAITGTLITLYVTWKGAKFVLRAVKGA